MTAHEAYLKSARSTLRISASMVGDVDTIYANLSPEESQAILSELTRLEDLVQAAARALNLDLAEAIERWTHDRH